MSNLPLRGDSRAVSELVGTVLLLGITVAIFSVLSMAVMAQLHQNPPPKNVEFRVDEANGRTTITNVWGDSLQVSDVRLFFDLDDLRTVQSLGADPLVSNLVQGAFGITQAWDLGESVRLACPTAETCAYPGHVVHNVTVVQVSSNSVIFSNEEGVVRGAHVNPIPDLVASITSVTDPDHPPGEPLYESGSVRVTAAFSNGGIRATPAGTQIDVTYYLDGNPTPFYTFHYSGSLLPGQSFTTENPAYAAPAGPHTVRVRIDGLPAVTEASSDNNEAVRDFTVLAGGP